MSDTDIESDTAVAADGRYWTCTPEVLLLHLAECGVPVDDRHIWRCPCGGEQCQSAVGYGIGPAPANADAKWTGSGPMPSHVLWVVPSTKYQPGTVPVMGLGPGETLADLYSFMHNFDPAQAHWYGYMFEAGLRDVLERSLADLGAT